MGPRGSYLALVKVTLVSVKCSVFFSHHCYSVISNHDTNILGAHGNTICGVGTHNLFCINISYPNQESSMLGHMNTSGQHFIVSCV
jgi:hypothetical protein